MSDEEFSESDIEIEAEEDENKTYIGKIYRLYYKDDPTQFYIGSTSMTLPNRMSVHRQNASVRTSKLYSFMREHGIRNFDISLEEEVDVASADELRRCEQRVINALQPPLNMQRASRSEEQKKEQIKEAKKRYAERNKQRIRCDTCGYGFESNKDLNKHNNSQRHRANLARQE